MGSKTTCQKVAGKSYQRGGVLATLSRIFRFCGLGSSDDHHPNSDPGISEMVTPGARHVTAEKGVLATLSRIFRFCGLGSSGDHHPNPDPGISEMVTPRGGM
jgi:hypothetical protein